MQVNYDDALDYITRTIKVNLFPYQKVMLKAFCEGLEVRTARCVGRTYVADAFGKYIAHILSDNDYSAEPDVTFPYQCAVKHNLLGPADIAKARTMLCPEQFAREYLCR